MRTRLTFVQWGTWAIILTAAIVTLFALGSLWPVAVTGQSSATWKEVFGAVLVLGWNVLPIVVMAVIAWTMSSRFWQAVGVLLGSLVVCGGGIFVQIDTYNSTDGQSALTILFLPLWQLVGCLVTVFIAAYLGLLDRRRGRGEQ